ncbi:MAG: hypothetical protein ACOCYU_06985 [Brevefilum sp.]
MEKRPNDFDGFSYYIKDPAEIEQMDQRASIMLEPGQIAFLKDYPHSLKGLVKQAAPLAEVPNLAKWLASLWNIPLTLEVHTSSELYDMNFVWLRFDVQDEDEEEGLVAWKPGINLLSLRPSNQLRVPDLLMKIYSITGEINHNGYGVAGRLHHPDRVGDEVAFYETLYNDKAFYRLPHMRIYWEFHGGFYKSEEERRKSGLYFFDDGLPEFLDLYFGSLLDKKELRIDREGEVIE